MMSDRFSHPRQHAPILDSDVETRLLYSAYARKPLNLLMTAAATVIIAGLLWQLFPAAQMTLWTLALLSGVALGTLEYVAFKRAAPKAHEIARWRKIFLAQATLAGATWALGPCLMIADASGAELTLFVTILLAVCTVAMISVAEQRVAMLAFVGATVAPPAIVLWHSGAATQGTVALALVCGMVFVILVGLRFNQAVRELLENQSRNRAILDTALDAIIEINAQGRITDWNRRAETVFGWRKEEALGLLLAETIIAQAHRAAVRGELGGVGASGTEYVLNRRTERVALRKDGTQFPVEMTVTPLQRGDVWHFTAFIADITERKLAQAKIIDSEERFRTLIDSTREAIAVHRNGLLIYVNPATVAMFGASSTQDLLGRPVLDFVHPDFLPEVLARMKNTPADQVVTPLVEQKFLKLDGSAMDVEIQATRIRYDGAPAVQAAMRDVTERKQAEEAQRIAATAFDSQQGMIVTNAERVILRVNKAFTEITGYGTQEAVGQNPRLLASGRHDGAFFAALWASVARDGSWQGEIWNRRKSGEVFPAWLTISAVTDDGGQASHYVGAFTDISSRKSAEDQIRNLAFYDPLTGLPNRRLLMDRLAQALLSSARHQRKGALLYIDLDNFKTLNDTLGHFQGDLLLEQVARRLSSCTCEGDTVARLSGDEFVVLLEDLSRSEPEAANQAETAGEKILLSLHQPYQLDNGEYHSTSSIGITLLGGQQQGSIDEPLKRAELAMYQAKAVGRDTLRFFDPQMQAAVTSRAALEAELREAILKVQLVLHYQPQVVGEGRLTGVEALVRWQHPRRGLVAPAEFIPLAEDTGLILPLGQWVLEAACAQLARWAAQPALAQLSIAVNVSARQFHHEDFVHQVLTVLERSGANPKHLKLELTESLLVDDVEGVIAKMSALKATGVGFSLDDFGTGYSSLSYLKRLPLDQLKIDQGFIQNILTDPNDAAIAKMVIALADSMGLAVLAEGVEIEAQRVFLAHLGCHAYQGYLFSRPLPLADFEAYARAATLPS